MKTTINFNDFRDAFRAYDRENFSREGAMILFEYFEELNPDIELDVLAICCDFSEDTTDSIEEKYSLDLTDDDGKDTLTNKEKSAIVREYLHDNTTLLGETASSFVYCNF